MGNSVKEKSLAAHAALLEQKAVLTQLEVREKEGAPIQREAAFGFLSQLIRTLCNEIRSTSLPEAD